VLSVEPSLVLLLAAAGISAIVVGFLKASVGGGIGLVLTPTLTLVLPAPIVLALVAPLMSMSDPMALRYYWRQWDSTQLRQLLPTTIAGVLLGSVALAFLSEFWLRKAIGGIALTFALFQLVLIVRGRRLFTGVPHWSAGATGGLLAGLASAIAHSGGVVLGPYLLGVGLGNAAVVATGNAVVVVTNVLKLASYWTIGLLTGTIMAAALAASPLLLLGTWLGYRVNRWLPRRWFELALIAIAVAGSTRLLLTR
jgi:uncharacterized membrane protein YfcA